MDFNQFFSRATDKDRSPYPFQNRFATNETIPHLIQAPTGSGKTATAVLGWLWRYFHGFKGKTPRRLVYCLPMRVLVEQSVREARKWIANLNLDVSVHLLMGGVDTEDWHLNPEKPALLIGTQDMLLSRALNRGYAASRFHWPIDFGLLNTDCLWVFDEPQLMAGGVSTSAQLAGLRKQFNSFGECPSVWMSATLEPNWLDTIDFQGRFSEAPLELDENDFDVRLPLHKRMTASKRLEPLDVLADKDGKAVAKAVLNRHENGTQTLVILNTVDRAKAVFAELEVLKKKEKRDVSLLLVHSRFRPRERLQLNEELQRKDVDDRIMVSTQVVEAGVDISARTLVTELCPWASVVQRIGRCNRTGDDGPGKVYWIDLNEKFALPYSTEELDFARTQLFKLAGKEVSPKALDDFKKTEKFLLPFTHRHVLRRRDLLDLFDTSPDLSGNDIDVSRFVRSDDPDTDVQVFWRDTNVDGWEASPIRDELCNVPVGQFRSFVKEYKPEALVWDHLEGVWVKLDPRQLRPGMVIMLHSETGGYSDRLGWDSSSKGTVTPCPPSISEFEEAAGSDPNSVTLKALTITQHTSNVCRELGEIIKAIPIGDWNARLTKAARWHDAGKAHAAFQEGMRTANPDLAADQLWAKSGKNGKLIHGRKYFRHELASALAALQHGLPFAVAYLISSHHGRVRLSIRSLPGEEEHLPKEMPERFALGVYQHDPLPAVDLGSESVPETTLDLTPMRLGGDMSWTGRALDLLEELGPFKLAYLEALLRAADVRASKKEATNA